MPHELPTPTAQNPVNITTQDMKRFMDENRYIVNPRYQRGTVGAYKPEFRTRLVESLIRGFPIPPILTTRGDRGIEIIDGQQRVTTISAYINNEFAISGEHLMILGTDYYNGKRYRDLDEPHKDRISDATYLAHQLDGTMPPWQVYVLINGGMNPLSNQELRKARFSEYEHYWSMDEVVGSETWRPKLTPANRKREKDAELYHKGFISYLWGDNVEWTNLSSSAWVEAGLNRIVADHTVEQLDVKLRTYTRALTIISNLFNETPNKPFRRINLVTGRTTQFTTTYIPPMSYAFGKLRDNHSHTSIMEKKDELVGAFDYFMSVDDDDSNLEKDTSGNQPSRFIPLSITLCDILFEIMSDSFPLTRTAQHYIGPALRAEVLENAERDEHNRPICGICGHAIEAGGIDLDHVEQVVEGGGTDFGNLRVTHAACNRGRRD